MPRIPQHGSSVTRLIALAPVALSFLAACEAPAVPDAADTVVGRAADSSITLDEALAPVRLRLYDLEIQKFRTLREATETAILARIDDGGAFPVAELTLEPPLPPRLDVVADPARVRPPRDGDSAPAVSVVVFCDFESPHCARLQPRLDALKQLYPGVIEVGARDFVMPFHRNAGLAAQAARCALGQESFWLFHDAVFAGSGALDRVRLERAAATARLEPGAFAACLGSEAVTAAVGEDTDRALQLGLEAVPGVFVNGLYAGPEPGTDHLIWLVEHELAAHGIASPRETEAAAVADLPIAIRALVSSSTAGLGFALVGPSDSAAPATLVREGDALAPAIIVRRVTAEGLELLDGGRLERLTLDSSGAAAAAAAGDRGLVITPHVAVPVTLDRNEVIVRLADRAGLESELEPVALRAGPYRLVRIREVEPGSLYELLGLRDGDVIVGVNEQPMHEADIPLWRALETEHEVRVRVMRSGGTAEHFTYRFDD